jgi:hypothetical protein
MGDYVDELNNVMPSPGNGRPKRARIDREGNFVAGKEVYGYNTLIRPAVRYNISTNSGAANSVKAFGAVGDGVTNDTVAIQTALNSSVGKELYFPTGTYVITSSLQLVSAVTITGEGQELTRIFGNGNFPILIHAGSSTNTLGDVVIRDIQIRGQSAANPLQFGVFCDWGGNWIIENVSFRLCKIGYYQGTSANNVLNNINFISCDTALWFGPIDQSGGGTPDNTVFMHEIISYTTGTTGMRVEGMTGMKATNCAFLEGDVGIHVGNYVQATTPRALYDGATTNVPSAANARNIRWLHLNNFYTDSNAQEGWIVDEVSTGKPTQELKLVNCWSGNSNSATNNISINNSQNVQIVGTTILNSIGRSMTVANTTRLQISALVADDWDRGDAGLPSVYLNTCTSVIVDGIMGECAGSTQQSTNYLLHLDTCSSNNVSKITSQSSRLVLVEDCTVSKISDCTTLNNTASCITETGTSTGTRICNVTGGVIPTIIGTNSALIHSGVPGSTRSYFDGGSVALPGINWQTSPASGFYRVGTHGMAYSHNGTAAIQVFDNSGTLCFLPGTAAANDLGLATRRWRNVYGTEYHYGTTGSVFMSTGTGSPEGVVTASPGALYLNLSGGAGTTLYIKESGSVTNTGWVAK